MEVYISDIEEFETLDYRIAGQSGNQAEAFLKRFGGLDDFYYDEETGCWECDHRDFVYWAENMLDMEDLYSRLISFRKKFGDNIVNAVADRALEYSNVEEIIGAQNMWLDRLAWIDVKHNNEKYVAYESELELENVNSTEVGYGKSAEEAIIDYIKKSVDN